MHARKILKPGLFAMVELTPDENWPFVVGSVAEDYKSVTCEPLIERPGQLDIAPGSELLLVCSTENGIYRFPTKVLEVEQDPARLTLGLVFDGATHIQRREFFRLARPLVYARYRALTGPEDIFDRELKEAPVKDLSGNGLSFVIPIEDELQAGSPIKIEIELASRQIINLVGEVVRCLTDEPIKGKSLMCIHFSLIEERDRDRIIGQLFREQLDRAGRRKVNRGS